MPKPHPCIEQTIDIPFGDKLLRLWIDQDEVQEKPLERPPFLDELITYLNDDHSEAEIITYVETNIPRLNAAQVKQNRITNPNQIEYGQVAYFVEFDNNTHG